MPKAPFVAKVILSIRYALFHGIINPWTVENQGAPSAPSVKGAPSVRGGIEFDSHLPSAYN